MVGDQTFSDVSRGFAAVRAAEALLRTLGGCTISVRVPINVAGTSGEFGVAGAATEDVALSPVVVRSLRKQAKGARGHVELLISAASLASAKEITDAAGSEAFFDSALGVVHDMILKRIVSFSVDDFGGTPYLYRVVVQE
jgi:hypothetical protein